MKDVEIYEPFSIERDLMLLDQSQTQSIYFTRLWHVDPT